jgi:sugar phosphate isomerase/epimerase
MYYKVLKSTTRDGSRLTGKGPEKTMTNPRLAMCNFISDPQALKRVALDHGFSGIDWSFDLESLPSMPSEESQWARRLSLFAPLELRYHCPFYRIDLGHDDPQEAKKAENVFRRIIRLVSKVGGRYLSIHIGLGLDSTEPLSWDATIDNLRRLVSYGAQHGVTICLENLRWGWTSKPHLFEKLIRGSGAGVTFDLGHAHVCEAIRSRYYTAEDFVTPHSDRVHNAHVYHAEISGLGHVPPDTLEDVVDRLDLLDEIGCPWWVLEVRNLDGLLQTKSVVEEYLIQSRGYGASRDRETQTGLASKGLEGSR